MAKDITRRDVVKTAAVGVGTWAGSTVLYGAQPETDRESFPEIVRPTVVEAESRPTRKRKLTVLEYTPSDQDAAMHLVWAGTIGVFVAEDGSSILQEIRDAVQKKDGNDVRIAKRLRDTMLARTRMDIKAAVDLLTRQDVFATLTYGSRAVASNLFVPDGLEVCPIFLPYNGGELETEGFTFIEHYKESSRKKLDIVLLKRTPPLTPAEKAALEQIPPEQLEWNTSHASACWAVTAVTIAAVVSTLTGLCCAITDELLGTRGVHLDDEVVSRLGPAGTARKLLGIRREIMEGRYDRAKQ